MSSEIIAAKMENIKTIFQSAQDNATKQNDIGELIKQLETIDSEFLSVGYEATSMELALKDFQSDESMKSWNTFVTLSKNHAPQVYVGLGWAIAKEKHVDKLFLDALNPEMRFRVWDGCGYFDGIFRQRQVIKNQSRLEYILENDFHSYDQGLGRSLWYICKGDENKIQEMVEAFATERHADLWRGIGIACSYVGGCEESALKKLIVSAKEHSAQLGIGATLVAKSRILSNCLTKDIELNCKIFRNMSAKEAMESVGN